MTQATLDWEYQQEVEEACAHRLELERRFSVPGCPWGCDGSGWRELLDHEEPGDKEFDTWWRGGWWTPCECNVTRTWRDGEWQVKVVRPLEDACHICGQPFVPAESGQALCPACAKAEREEWEAERENRLDHIMALAMA